MNKAEKINTCPRADIYSYKSLGYSFKTALADILDNSISANSNIIKVTSLISENRKEINILDDGFGMNLTDLIVAMRPGGKDPLMKRNANDLGRFGLGLKSSSFSQCNKLKVITKAENNDFFTRTWDLNYVIENDEWRLFEEDILESEKKLIGDHGTIIKWSEFGTKSEKDLQINLKESFEYSRLVFHKIIEKKGLRIYFNSQEVLPFDPFFKNSSLVMKRPLEEKSYGIIQTHILPIPKNIPSKSDKENFELINGFNDSQGVYVYREDRLISHGGWFNILPKNDIYKLARVSINYSNDLDEIWSLDVVKSKAIPPTGTRDFFKNIFNDAIQNSKSSFIERGRRVRKANPFSKLKPDNIWLNRIDKETQKNTYHLNIKNKYIEFYCKKNGINTGQLSPLFKVISDLIPVEKIIENQSENPNTHIKSEFSENRDLIIDANLFLKELINSGKTKEESKNVMLKISPFNKYPEIIASL